MEIKERKSWQLLECIVNRLILAKIFYFHKYSLDQKHWAPLYWQNILKILVGFKCLTVTVKNQINSCRNYQIIKILASSKENNTVNILCWKIVNKEEKKLTIICFFNTCAKWRY